MLLQDNPDSKCGWPECGLPCPLKDHSEERTWRHLDVLSSNGNPGDSGSTERIWPGRWYERGADMIRIDLVAAAVPFETEQGRLDFHALRHSYITSLSAAGIHTKTAQELARHSDINLTMGVYSHLQLRDLGASVNAIPTSEPSESILGTGPIISWHQYWPRKVRFHAIR